MCEAVKENGSEASRVPIVLEPVFMVKFLGNSVEKGYVIFISSSR